LHSEEFHFVLFVKYCYGYGIKEDEMGGTWSAHEVDDKWIKNNLSETSKGKPTR
jgi:hypothetical protein